VIIRRGHGPIVVLFAFITLRGGRCPGSVIPPPFRSDTPPFLGRPASLPPLPVSISIPIPIPVPVPVPVSITISVPVPVPVILFSASSRATRSLTVPRGTVRRGGTTIIAPDRRRRVFGPLTKSSVKIKTLQRNVVILAWMLKREPSKFLPCLDYFLNSDRQEWHWYSGNIHIVVSIFGIALAAELHKSVTAFLIRRCIVERS
jgi:hypothetical protein